MVERMGVKGGKALEAALLRLPNELDRARVTGNALAAGGRVIRDEAKLAVPVDTGELRDAIVVRRVRGRAGEAVVGFLKPTSRRAHLTEFGTSKASARPFMRPALDAGARAAINAIARAMKIGIERVAAKMARRRGRR
jgi:HK97 gp10 family phage protein